MKVMYLSCFLLLASCKTDNKTQAMMNGKWELTYGEYNGQPAPGLEKIYFSFHNDSLTTNFSATAEEVESTYSIKEKQFIQQTQEPVTYDIEELTDSILKLKTELRGSDFFLTLTKNVQ
jgi:Lipocalin-like domain